MVTALSDLRGLLGCTFVDTIQSSPHADLAQLAQTLRDEYDVLQSRGLLNDVPIPDLMRELGTRLAIMKIGDCKASCFLDDCVKQAMLVLRMFESMIGDHLKATKALICKRMTKKEAVEAQVNQFGSLVRGIVEEGGLIEQYRRCQLDRFKLTILDAAGQASVQGDRSGLAFYFAEAFTASSGTHGFDPETPFIVDADSSRLRRLSHVIGCREECFAGSAYFPAGDWK